MSDVLLTLASVWVVLSLVLGLAIVAAGRLRDRRETVVRPLTLSEIERLGEADPMPVDMPDRILERLDRIRRLEAG